MGEEIELEFDIEIKEKVVLEKPKDYAVVLLNDDYTPMEFVIEILIMIFQKNEFDAQTITMDIHQDGQGTAGIFKFDIAETKAVQVMDIARDKGYPLMAQIMEID